MPEMISLTPHKYGERYLTKGDRFVCEGRHVELMIKLGRAVLVEHYEDLGKVKAMSVDNSALYLTRDMSRVPRTIKRKKKAAA